MGGRNRIHFKAKIESDLKAHGMPVKALAFPSETMLAYNLFLLFKMDFAGEAEFRQQIKTFRLKYIFLAAKIIKTVRSVVMKLSNVQFYEKDHEK